MKYRVDRYFIADIKLRILNITTIEKFDSKKMCKIYDEWPTIARKSWEKNHDKFEIEKVKHIVFAGMGGSGTLGDFFAAILSKTNLHVNVVKGYILPKNVTSKTLIVIVSVSGNTTETLEILKSAKKIGCNIIVFSSGGQMEKYCKKNKINFRKVLKFNSPRASLVSYLYSMLNVLEKNLPVKKSDINNSIKKLEETKMNIFSNNLTKTNVSLNLAFWIIDIPLIYYPWGLKTVAIRFKNSLQENAKSHAMIEDVIETSHNGIVAWERKTSIQPILIQGEDDNVRTKERWKIFEKYFLKNNINYKIIKSEKGDIITKLINLIYVLDYSSIYLSILEEVDPSPVESIKFIKKLLS